MQSISDVIEDFILSTMEDSEMIELSRNQLAKHFSCVPSQINYVLNTRFTFNKGYVIESSRGGAGFVKVIRVKDDGDTYFKNLLSLTDNPLSYNEACQLLDNMNSKNYLTEKETVLLKRAVSPKSVNNPLNMDNIIRANILKEVIMEVARLVSPKV